MKALAKNNSPHKLSRLAQLVDLSGICKSAKSLSSEDTFPSVIVVEIDLFSLLILSDDGSISQEVLETLKTEIIDKFSDAHIYDFGYERLIIVTAQNKNPSVNSRFQKISKNINTDATKRTGKPVKLGLKAGYADIDDISEIERTIEHALAALIEIQKHKRMIAINFKEMQELINKHHSDLEMAAYFLNAYQKNRLKLAFQPVICAKTGATKSYESLLRIVTEDGSLISAGPFITVAEKFGFIHEIDLFVLDLVVKEVSLHKGIRLSFNVSNISLEDGGWLNHAKKVITPELAKSLIVEITETGIMRDLEAVSCDVDRIKELGCEVSIDDFGAGYTSFKQLKLLNIDVLKIDGVFIRDIVENPESQLFVQTLLEFARAYHLKTVAEFVETGEIARILINLGVDYLQGFYFGTPMANRPWVQNDNV